MRNSTATPFARLDIALIAVVMLIAILARWLPGPRTIDDAFITFRYARNIVEGQGFTYNPPSRVLGTTTPLFTLVMAAIGGVTRDEDYPYSAIAVSALADVATVALLFLLARRLTGNRWVGALLGVLYAVSPTSVTFAVGGMETSVNILWIVLAAWCYMTNRAFLMGIAAGLGFLTRIDAVLWIAPLFLAQLIERWQAKSDLPLMFRVPILAWAGFSLIVAPWIAFSMAYFGTPFPRSLAAKAIAYVVEPGSALTFFIQRYATPFIEFDTFGSLGAMIGAVAYLLLSLIGIAYARRHVPRLLPLLLYPWLYLIVFSAANPLMFRWYIAPPIPALMLGIVTGAWALLHGLSAQGRRRAVLTAGIGALAVVWGVSSLNGWTLRPDHGPDRPAPRMAWHEIELAYQHMGLLLRDQYGVTPQTRVASADIGAIGYFSRAHIVDTVGLVTPELSAYYPFARSILLDGQNYAVPPRLILDTQPQFFVTMEGFVRLGLEQNAQFKAEYGEPVLKLPFPFYGADMRLYRRR